MQQTAFHLRPWSGIGIVLGAAVFLSMGFVLAIALTILGAAALLSSWLRGSWKRPRAPRAPVTIEGCYSRQ